MLHIQHHTIMHCCWYVVAWILVHKYTIIVNISVDLDHYLYTDDKHKLRNGQSHPCNDIIIIPALMTIVHIIANVIV